MKTIRRICTVAALFASLSVFALTATVNGITWTYTVSNGKASVGGGGYNSPAVPKSTSGAITIPSTLGGYSVTSIGNNAFYNCSGLTTVTMLDSVTSIGDYAFSDCSGLTSVTIGSSVASIGIYAFRNCIELTSVTVSASVTSIGDHAFSVCSGLESFIVSDGNTSYKSVSGLLLSKDGKTIVCGVNGEVAIPDGVARIGDYAFYGRSRLTSVTMPDSVTSIGGYAFSGCSGLTSISIPDGVMTINDYTFYRCSNLTSVTIPLSVTSIGEAAFNICDNLSSIIIPNGVRNIGKYAFFSGGLKEIFLPIECSVGTDVIPTSTTVYRYKSVQSVSLNVAGGASSVGSISVKWGETYGFLPTPTRPGYTFIGWRYGSKEVTWDTIVSALGDHTLTAQWALNKYSVTFDADGGVGGTSGQQDYGSPIVAPEVTRIGYTFKGWSPSVHETVPSSNVTYAAQWTPNKYIVEFDSNGGEGGFAIELDYGSDIVAPKVSREGYGFIGWSPEVAGTVPLNGAMYLAQWEINKYMVTFDANGGVGGMSERQDYRSAIVAPTVTRTGYHFVGWTPEVAATVPADDVAYTAQWEINRYEVTFDANGGMCGTASTSIDHGSVIGDLPVPTRGNAVFLGWFTEAEGGVDVDSALTITEPGTLYAHWLTEIACPEIVSSVDSSMVTIKCATEGATIYYTDDGSTPRRTDDYLYTGPIAITETTTFKAIAVYGSLRSEYATVTIAKKPLSLVEALDVGEMVTVSTDASHPWIPILDATAKTGDATAKSGAIGDRASTWLSASVSGAGTMTFWCKTSCEHDEDDTFTWDRLMVYTNDVEIAEWRMDGETDWTQRTLQFAGGNNTVKWTYFKDRTGTEGEDCAWVDAVTWTPAQAELIPSVASDASAATVNAAVNGVGFADAVRISAAIGGSATEYAKFKAWAESMGATDVIASGHAASSYLLGAEALLENEPEVEFGAIEVGAAEGGGLQGSAGTVATVSVTVKDGGRAVQVDAEKVAAMFEATGDLGDWNGAAKLPVNVEVVGGGEQGTASPAMRFRVSAGDGSSDLAFLRIRK